MEIDSIALFRRAGIGIDQGGKPNLPPGIVEWIGRVTVLPRELSGFGLKAGCEIWQVAEGFAPFDQSGFERWLVDAPKGQNLLISLRELSFSHHKLSQSSEFGIHIWDREQLATFIGNAVLSGCISFTEQEVTDNSESETPLESELQKWIDAKSVMIGELKSQVGKPVLREVKLWAIKGKLTCDELSEDAEWLVVANHDGLKIIDVSESFISPPKLERISTVDYSISERDRLLSELLSESRRMDSSSESNLSMMRRWQFLPENAEIIPIECFTPEWR